MLTIAPENRPKANNFQECLFCKIVPSIMQARTTEYEDSTPIELQSPSRHAPAQEEAARSRIVMDTHANSVAAPEGGLPILRVAAYPDRPIVKVDSTFVRIVHEEHIIQTILSGTSGWVAYLSRNKVYLLSMSLLGRRKLWKHKLSCEKIAFDNSNFLCRPLLQAPPGNPWHWPVAIFFYKKEITSFKKPQYVTFLLSPVFISKVYENHWLKLARYGYVIQALPTAYKTSRLSHAHVTYSQLLYPYEGISPYDLAAVSSSVLHGLYFRTSNFDIYCTNPCTCP